MKKAAYFGCVEPRPFPYAEEYATMSQTSNGSFTFPSSGSAASDDSSVADPLTQIIRRGARFSCFPGFLPGVGRAESRQRMAFLQGMPDTVFACTARFST